MVKNEVTNIIRFFGFIESSHAPLQHTADQNTVPSSISTNSFYVGSPSTIRSPTGKVEKKKRFLNPMLSFLTQLCSPAGKLRHIYPKLNCLTEVKYPNAQRNWFPYSKYPRTQLPRRYSRKKLESFGQGFLAAKSIYRLISKRFWPW